MTKRRIIIADDEPLMRLDLQEMLENLGHDVVGQVGDGRAAVDLARELQPDLVILDIKMPELDGVSAARVLAEERVAPVLLLTAYSDREFIDGARDAGVMGYIVKPYGEAQLTPAIDIALARFQEFRTLQKELGDTQEALQTRKVVERAKGVLMDTLGRKETDAFRRIEKRSMNSRK